MRETSRRLQKLIRYIFFPNYPEKRSSRASAVWIESAVWLQLVNISTGFDFQAQVNSVDCSVDTESIFLQEPYFYNLKYTNTNYSNAVSNKWNKINVYMYNKTVFLIFNVKVKRKTFPTKIIHFVYFTTTTNFYNVHTAYSFI